VYGDHVATLWALEAVKRLEVAMEDAIVVETISIPEVWADFVKRYCDILATGEAKSVHEEEE
jgi:hypothetical protein